jgi:hypothetical protein
MKHNPESGNRYSFLECKKASLVLEQFKFIPVQVDTLNYSYGSIMFQKFVCNTVMN